MYREMRNNSEGESAEKAAPSTAFLRLVALTWAVIFYAGKGSDCSNNAVCDGYEFGRVVKTVLLFRKNEKYLKMRNMSCIFFRDFSQEPCKYFDFKRQ